MSLLCLEASLVEEDKPMLRTRLALSITLLANLVPLAGIVFFKWDVSTLVFLYWIENLIVGGFTIVRLAIARADTSGEHISKVFMILFFSFHFGIFCAVHGMFLQSFFGVPDLLTHVLPAGIGVTSLFLPTLVYSIGRGLLRGPATWATWAILGLVVSHGVSFIQRDLLGGPDTRESPAKTMVAPYPRIVLLHIAILATGFITLNAGSPSLLLVLLVLLKTGADVALHIRKRGHKP